MSTPNDFARRFFADFIASRIKAWGMQEDRSGTSPQSPAHDAVGPLGGASQQPESAGPAGSAPDPRRPRLPGLSERRHSPGLGIG
jgi:hypothetical protein